MFTTAEFKTTQTNDADLFFRACLLEGIEYHMSYVMIIEKMNKGATDDEKIIAYYTEIMYVSASWYHSSHLFIYLFWAKKKLRQ